MSMTNPLNRVDVSEFISEGLEKCESINDVLMLLEKLTPEQGLMGSHSFYGKFALTRAVVAAEQGWNGINVVTRSGGLREKVNQILMKKR